MANQYLTKSIIAVIYFNKAINSQLKGAIMRIITLLLEKEIFMHRKLMLVLAVVISLFFVNATVAQGDTEAVETSAVDVVSFALSDVNGPLKMKSAYVQPTDTFDLKNVFYWGTSSDGSDDDFVQTLSVEWGFMADHELLVRTPINYGDGAVGPGGNGNVANGDAFLGWQWQLLDNDGIVPAFALYNELRLPTGYHSSGADYQITGIMTWPFNDGQCRLHLNPFMRFNGANDIDRHFQAGTIIGMDHQLRDDLIVNMDYILDSGELNGYGMQHTMEAGLDWLVDSNRTVSLATTWTMDGDDQGDNFGMMLSYNVALGN